MIYARNLCYQYKNGKKVLRNINFSIKKGEFVALIGQNGAGKTTLLKHFNALLKPTGGGLSVNGTDVSTVKTSVLSKHIGFLFQNPDHQIFCSTVFDEIAFGLRNTGKNENEIERLVAAAALKVGIEKHLETNPFSMSKGQRQRIALASVLAMETEILVLDEPTTGQDYKEAVEIMEIIKELNSQGKTIIMVTHDMELVAAYARRVIILHNGTVLEDGEPGEVFAKTESMDLSNLQPPQIYVLAKKFHKQGMFKDVYALDEMLKEIISYPEGGTNACNG
jgi:energy-coupling factor transport system ATP-binding protein